MSRGPPSSTLTATLLPDPTPFRSQALDKPDEDFATRFSGEDLAAWSIVQGPARLLLLLTVHRAGEYVQTRWVESIVEPLAKLPASEQIATLYGEQGKLD